MAEVTAHADRVKSGAVSDSASEILVAVRRGWMTSEILLPQKDLPSLPPGLSTTLQLQLAPPKKVTLARNRLEALLTSREPNICCRVREGRREGGGGELLLRRWRGFGFVGLARGS